MLFREAWRCSFITEIIEPAWKAAAMQSLSLNEVIAIITRKGGDFARIPANDCKTRISANSKHPKLTQLTNEGT